MLLSAGSQRMREEIEAHCRISRQQEIENPQQLVHGMRYRNIRGPSRRHSMHNRQCARGGLNEC